MLETVAQTIQLILAPVVMVSACAILLTGLLSRYAAINDRMRLLARERFDLLLGQADEATQRLIAERIKQIDTQIPILLHHHRLTHDAVLAAYSAVALYIADMFVIALGAVMYADWIAALVLVLFLGGTGMLLAGILITAREIRTSHQAVQYEVQAMVGRRRP